MKPVWMLLVATLVAGPALAETVEEPEPSEEPSEEPTPHPGAASYALCMACHGPDGSGNQALNAPALAGQPAWYGAKALRDYRSGARGVDPKDTFGMQMAPMAKTLSEDAVDAVSAYIEAMPPVALKHEGSGDVAAGEAAYGLCVSCHGADAGGIEAAGAPPLTGLPDWYVARQVANYRAGARGAADGDALGAQMATVAKLLDGDDAPVDVAAYIRTLGEPAE